MSWALGSLPETHNQKTPQIPGSGTLRPRGLLSPRWTRTRPVFLWACPLVPTHLPGRSLSVSPLRHPLWLLVLCVCIWPSPPSWVPTAGLGVEGGGGACISTPSRAWAGPLPPGLLLRL